MIADLEAKTRYGLEMAIAAWRLAAASEDDYRQRLLARHSVVFLDEFLYYAPCWRKALARKSATAPVARRAHRAIRETVTAAAPLKAVRDFLAAKRQSTSARRHDDIRTTLALWRSIDLDVLERTLVPASSAYDALRQVDPDEHQAIHVAPPPPLEAFAALRALDAPAEQAQTRVSSAGYAGARAGTLPVFGGGEIGQRIAQVNDVADQLVTARDLTPALRSTPTYSHLIRAALVSELDSLLTLLVGAPGAGQRGASSLRDLCAAMDAQDGARILTEIERALDPATRNELRTCRNLYGAHIDRQTPFAELIEIIDSLDVDGVIRASNWILDQLEYAAVFELRLGMLLFDELATTLPDDGLSPAPGAPLPPQQLIDSPYAVWVGGQAPYASASVAGLMAGRHRRIVERLGLAEGPSAGAPAET